MKSVVIVGCGRAGLDVGMALHAEGRSVTGIARSETSLARIAAAGLAPCQGDLDHADSLRDLPTGGTELFYFAPPPGGGVSDTRIRRFLDSRRPDTLPSRIVYISTSGVYGDCGGTRVDENTPPHPETARAKRRWDAEQALQAFGREQTVPVIILRVTGIYGPGRLPLQRIRDGQPVLRSVDARPTNRIHAADLVQVCLAAMARGKAGEVYNVCDGQESTMTDYFNAIADAFGLPRPPQVTLEEAREVMSPLMLTYVQESRRLDNRKMLQQLGVRLLYPTLKDGIQSCLEV